MATGDTGQTAGLTKYAATEDARLGYDNDNQRGDDIGDMRRIVSLWRSSNQALATGGNGAPVSWSSEVSDKFQMHAAANLTRVTVGKAGIYRITAYILIDSTTGMGSIFLCLNGAGGATPTASARSLRRQNGATGMLTPVFLDMDMQLAANDYLELIVIESAASGNVVGGSGSTASHMTVAFIADI